MADLKLFERIRRGEPGATPKAFGAESAIQRANESRLQR